MISPILLLGCGKPSLIWIVVLTAWLFLIFIVVSFLIIGRIGLRAAPHVHHNQYRIVISYSSSFLASCFQAQSCISCYSIFGRSSLLIRNYCSIMSILASPLIYRAQRRKFPLMNLHERFHIISPLLQSIIPQDSL
jgi:ABC-type spermidine/putrescine transport system permease subunit I